ncbi:MAG: hypothetical protein H6819_05715 [Phycisphaerales bacterium]|nr:hypothetical protein [Phycisphaerales bacterium]MCB9854722.1 hypothetical protein [Phycisphaerales bacterium]
MYIASMWLDFAPGTPSHYIAALKEFQTTVWPPLPNAWTAISVNANKLDEVTASLNAEFTTNLDKLCPLVNGKGYKFSPPFETSAWYRGTGGLHETNRRPVIYEPPSGSHLGFPYEYQSKTYDALVYVRASFVEVTMSL